MGRKDNEHEDKKSRKGRFALLLGAVGGVALYLRKKRERELDDALWEEPTAI